MGMVFAAVHRLMDRPVALKVIHPAYLPNPVSVERFHREVQAAARLRHPNVVTAHDADCAGDLHFLVMELVEGVSLGRLVQERGPLPVELACDYTRQAALGLQHAHEHGLVHRDVKPDNLMLTGGTIKLLDFGLAALTAPTGPGGMTDSGAILGTPDYLAPEQAEDARSIDCRADLYSLGCTLVYLLTGQDPFPATTPLKKILAHREKTPPPLDEVRPDALPGLAAVLARLMARNPVDRFQTADEVAAVLAPFASGGSVPSPPRSGPVRASPSPKRRTRFIRRAVCATAAAGLVLLLVWVWAAQREQALPTDDPTVAVVVQRGEVVRITDPKNGRTWDLRSKHYRIATAEDADGLRIELPDAESLILRRQPGGILSVDWPTRTAGLLPSWPSPPWIMAVRSTGAKSAKGSASPERSRRWESTRSSSSPRSSGTPPSDTTSTPPLSSSRSVRPMGRWTSVWWPPARAERKFRGW
jgi:serine/threonine protein kinase